MWATKKILKVDALSDIPSKLRSMGIDPDTTHTGPLKVSVSLRVKKRRKLKKVHFLFQTFCECCGPEFIGMTECNWDKWRLANENSLC